MVFMIVLGKSPKLGQQPKLAQPNFGWANFFHNMAGPKFGWANYGWATFLAGPIFSTFWLGQSLAAGPVLAGPILLDRYYGWAILAGLMAGSSIGPAKNLAQP